MRKRKALEKRAPTSTGFLDGWNDALEVECEIARAVMAEPIAGAADFAVKRLTPCSFSQW